jgi:hypothetical protein
MVTIFSVPLPLNLASLRRRRKILSRKIARRAFINRPPRRVSVTGFRQYTLWQKGPMELGMIDEDESVVQVRGPCADVVGRAIEVCRDTRILRDATTINYQPSARLPYATETHCTL